MPELPEVEKVRRDLQRVMRGARLVRVTTRRANLRSAFQDDFRARLEGRTVTAVSRRAKYLQLMLDSGEVLIVHLGMSGSFRVLRGTAGASGVPDRPVGDFYFERSDLEKHDHVVFELSSGATVVFNDPRRFGFMKVVSPGGADATTGLERLGPEPLARTFTPARLAQALHGRRTTLKAALLDQRVVAGLGNIYVSEALHRARLSPKRKASTLVGRDGEPAASPPALPALHEAIRFVLRKAIASRHSVGGDDRFLVYDREGERCPRRGCPGVIRRIVQGGRSTFFCPFCQR